MNSTVVMALALDPETIDSMAASQRRLVLGELASKLGDEGVVIISNYYHVEPSYVAKAKADYESGIRYHKPKKQ